jgi:hypothetical protein
MDKADVLLEIRRVASKGSGKAPGRALFETETGIGYGVWGRWWARWGDALKDAGLSPNQLNRAYSPKRLAVAFIGLTRELGHIPTRAELRVKAAASESFPSPNTFSRLGATKIEIIKAVRGYCEQREGFEDILAICRHTVPPPIGTRRQLDLGAEQRAEVHSDIGAVYLLKAGRYYKIGRSNSVGRRQYELSIQLPEHTSLIHEIATDDPVGIEAYWHQRFSAMRRNGEWFALRPDDVRAFKRRKFM